MKFLTSFTHSAIFFSCFALVASCGRKEEFVKSENPSETPTNTATDKNESEKAWNSYAISSAALLPKCDSTKVGALSYVRDEKKFYTCELSGWQVEDVQPKDSNAIVGRWIFHVDSYLGEPDLHDESANSSTHIGDVSITKFQNGTAFFAISGFSAEWNPTLQIYDKKEFSFSDFIPNTKTEYTAVYKFASYQNARLRLKINLSTSTPTLKAVVDIDGNFSNNIDKSYILTSVVP
jgi:hypothetical protein